LYGDWQPPEYPFSGPTGSATTTAVAFDAVAWQQWAAVVVAVEYGANVSEEWRQPEEALGPVRDHGTGEVVSLGEGGSITVAMEVPIRDGDGWDFAVFENSFSDRFLELAFVEVSSDGEHFVRFPNYSETADGVLGFGEIDPRGVYGYAGKYRAGYGVPFDLRQLADAYKAVDEPGSRFSDAYREHLREQFPHLDMRAIRFVRMVDIIGDGRERDCEGFVIYDPYPTAISAGFDLAGVGVRYVELPALELQMTAAGAFVEVEWLAGRQPFVEVSTDLKVWEALPLTAFGEQLDGMQRWVSDPRQSGFFRLRLAAD
jgi:hypothetical protein